MSLRNHCKLLFKKTYLLEVQNEFEKVSKVYKKLKKKVDKIEIKVKENVYQNVNKFETKIK